MPARECLGSDTHSFVTFHATLAGGVVRLVVHRAGGTREVCDIAPDGRIAHRMPAAPGAHAPPPEARAFFLERRCVDARRVEAADGTILGWLAYPACG